MTDKIDVNKPNDPLNETIKGEMVPLAFSTEIKSKKYMVPKKKSIDDYSFICPDDMYFKKVNLRNENVLHQGKISDNDDSLKYTSPDDPIACADNDNVCGISSRYLEKHQRPDYYSDSYIADGESRLGDDKSPLRESNINQPNSVDVSHFNRFSNPINESCSLVLKQRALLTKANYVEDNATIFSKNLSCDKAFDKYESFDNDNDDFDENNETIYMMKQVQGIDLDATSISGFDELMNDVTLHGSLDMTKLATNLRMSDKKKVEERQKDVLMNIEVNEDVILLSNKSCILWIGVPVQVSQEKQKHEMIYEWLYRNNVIKSFTLNLKSNLAQTVRIQIKKKTNCFFLTNSLGQDRTQETTIHFEPKTDKKFYVSFHPVNSNYHSDIIVIHVAHRKFKINLFGYAEPAIVELKGFVPIEDPTKAGKEALMKSYSKRVGRNTLSVSVFNSGARTAFVALLAQNTNIKFQPRIFLLIPKTKMEFDVTVTVTAEMKSVDFLMITVDEELRRAARLNFTELPNSDRFNIFHHIQIFSRLPEEKSIRQDDLPRFDYRPYLCRQINNSLRSCYLDFDCDDQQSSIGESASTIGMLSRSSMTARSALSNVERLYAKSLYVNSAPSLVHSLNQTLSAVVILNDVNRFPDTRISETTYLGLLIRNNNHFQVEWRISDMQASYSDSLLRGSYKEQLSTETSSVYSLNSIPLYNSADTMTIEERHGTLLANESVVVPVRFCPMYNGQTDCRCSIKVCDGDDGVLEREVAFVGHSERVARGVEVEGERCGAGDSWSGGIPGLSVDRKVERVVVGAAQDRKVTLKINIKNKTRHNMQLFLSALPAPFELKVTSIYLQERSNMLCVTARPTVAVPRTYRTVLVFVDNNGCSAFTEIIVDVK